MADFTQRLPFEVLTEVLEHAAVPDVLRFKQVNRLFRDVIVASPLIRHKIELYAIGLEYNPSTGVSLADSRRALLRYRSGLESLCPAEERTVENFLMEDECHTSSGGGVFAAILEDSVRLFALGSASREIPHREWEIPLPVDNPERFCFYPGADVIAFVERRGQGGDPRIEVHLRTLSGGEHHPDALRPAVQFTRRRDAVRSVSSLSITGSRLAVVAPSPCKPWRLIVWDWKKAELLFELVDHWGAVEFVDDYRLLASLDRKQRAPSSLVLVDTEKVGGIHVRTSFHLPSYIHPHTVALVERGAYEPSPAEPFVPFHRDPTQRIIALGPPSPYGYLVFRMESLLEFLKGRGESEIRWNEWKSHVVIASVTDDEQRDIMDIWVSGCRLFLITSRNSSPDSEMKVFDFSLEGRTKCLSEKMDPDGIRYLVPAVTRPQTLWNTLYEVYTGHDSILFVCWVAGATNLYVSRIWTF